MRRRTAARAAVIVAQAVGGVAVTYGLVLALILLFATVTDR